MSSPLPLVWRRNNKDDYANDDDDKSMLASAKLTTAKGRSYSSWSLSRARNKAAFFPPAYIISLMCMVLLFSSRSFSREVGGIWPFSSSSSSSSSSTSWGTLKKGAPTSATITIPQSCPYYDNIPSPFPNNFWYVKNPKTASSTLGGVFRSIGAHRGMALLTPKEPVFADIVEIKAAINKAYETSEVVGLANHMRFSKRLTEFFKTDETPMLLFTSVRDPVARFHSNYIQDCVGNLTMLTLGMGTADQAAFLQQMKESKGEMRAECLKVNHQSRMAVAQDMEENSQYEYIRDQWGHKGSSEETAALYDFIFVQERLFESLVAFAILFNLEFQDIAHLPAKVRTGLYTEASEMPADINDLVLSKSVKDRELWHHANKRLDERIAEIASHCGGNAYFDKMVKSLESIQEAVYKECGVKGHHWYEQYNFTTMHSYWRDNGRAPRCRDHVVHRVMREWYNVAAGGAAGTESGK